MTRTQTVLLVVWLIQSNKIQETFQASLKAVNLVRLIEDMDQQLEKLDFKNLPEKP